MGARAACGTLAGSTSGSWTSTHKDAASDFSRFVDILPAVRPAQLSRPSRGRTEPSVVRSPQFRDRRGITATRSARLSEPWRSARLAAPLVTTPYAAVRRVAVLAGRRQHCRPASTPLGRRRGCPGTRVRAKARLAGRPASVTWLRAERWSRDWRWLSGKVWTTSLTHP